jgi:pimeloyl-ACP methyl ester carboxylesterase
MNSIDTVVCTHGIWWHGVGMYLVKRHLEREFGMRALIFSYPSVANTLDENAELLARFIAENDINETHIVAHSLGGLVTLRMLAKGFSDVPGRVVCLGSPLSRTPVGPFAARRDYPQCRQRLGRPRLRAA